MAKREPPTEQTRLPIKVILPNQGKERRTPGGGGRPKPFCTVDREFRLRLGKQVAALRRVIVPLARRTGSIPMRVKLHPRALAKSHRPEMLFSKETCPIVGSGRPGELFLKATPKGLARLASRVKGGDSQKLTKELSAVDSIDPITPQVRRGGLNANDILRHSPRRGKGFVTRVRMFDFGEENDQELLIRDLFETCEQHGIDIEPGGYAPLSFIYEAECRSVDDVDVLANVVGVRSIAQMPVVQVIRRNFFNPAKLPDKLPATGKRIEELPVVVVVDSGVSDDLPELESWVVGRDSFVSPEYRNPEHGTFVAGLICWGDHLNPAISGIDSSPCAIFDLQVLPNSDAAKGDTGTVTESEFLESLETALHQHANQYKVWNLSLGTDVVCSLSEFSPLAAALDDLQENYQVSFVISTGNYNSIPLLNYPRNKAELERGRITSPADSVLGITVGSISHVAYKKNGFQEHHPSPFSRHGAGPNYVIKPDLIHYGGSCSLDASYQVGVRSIAAFGTAENIGTSFSAPFVSRTLANIYHEITPTPSPVLARAVLTHNARDPRSGGRVPDGDEHYFGFGLPSKLPQCLECTSYSSTLVFEDTLRRGYYLEWNDFPYPSSIHRSGRYFGEIWMTVAFSPSRGARWGSEYCKAHIEAHMGVYFRLPPGSEIPQDRTVQEEVQGVGPTRTQTPWQTLRVIPDRETSKMVSGPHVSRRSWAERTAGGTVAIDGAASDTA